MLREATAADAALLVSARRRMFEDMGEVSDDSLAQIDAGFERWLLPRIADGSAGGWIAEEDGEWVGAVTVSHDEVPPSRSNPTGRQSYLFGLWVRHDRRRRGIARAIVERCIADARERGEGAVTLYASDAGRPLYESLSFGAAPAMRLLFDCRREPAGDAEAPDGSAGKG